MAQRIGQAQLRLSRDRSRRSGPLDEITGLIDWAGVDRHLVPIYASAKGGKAWPPLSLFKALLLSVWYDLSDVKLAEVLEDRASFRRSCGFASDGPKLKAARPSFASGVSLWRARSTGRCSQP